MGPVYLHSSGETGDLKGRLTVHQTVLKVYQFSCFGRSQIRMIKVNVRFTSPPQKKKIIYICTIAKLDVITGNEILKHMVIWKI